MTYEEAIKKLKEELDIWERSAEVDDCYWEAQKFIKAYKTAIEALEKQRYIDAKIEWLKTLNQFDMILVSDVLDWFEDAKVEDD